MERAIGRSAGKHNRMGIGDQVERGSTDRMGSNDRDDVIESKDDRLIEMVIE